MGRNGTSGKRIASPEPAATGVANVGGQPVCRATGKRCLGARQAAELVARAKHGGAHDAERYHCGDCTFWHYTPGPKRAQRPKRARTPERAKRQAWRRGG